MNVPKLRFKEFTGEWEEKLIGDCFVKINDRNKTKSINNVISNTAKYGLVKQEEYFDKDIAIQENTENYYVIDKGDFVYNPRKSVEAPYGPIRLYQLEETGIVSPLYLCFRSKNKLFDYFYNYFFQSSKWYRYIYRNGDSGARADRVNIKDEVFFSLNTFLPIMDEQEKIVDFLNIVCRKINNQQAVVESLEKQKKGLMQKIFSQELRFKDDDGKEFPAWKEKKLGEVGEITTGKTPDTSNEGYWNGTIPFITPTDMNGNKYLKVSDRSVTEKIRCKLLKSGTVLVTCIGATIGKMAITTRSSITNQQINSIFSDKENNEFLYYALLNVVPYIKKLKSNNTMPILNKSEFSMLQVKLPCNKEQKKIADFLALFDEKIEREKVILEHWQQIKKGLLQQMFV